MFDLRTRLAAGARWSVAIRVLERSIGFVSTLILVRLLAPDDFGVVAMGTAIQEILSALTSFGFTQALIRMRRRDHNAYSTAFTLNVLTGAGIAVVLLAAIPLAIGWYSNDKVAAVLVVLALSSFVGGFRNPGLVRYERALDFRPFFAIALARKLGSFLVAVFAALFWGDYRALLAGMLVGAVLETGASYRLTHFRPRFTLDRAKELMGFSLWWVGGQTIAMFGRRGQDLLVGKYLGSATLGYYSVALDIARIGTAEVVSPLMRAVYPGYIQMKNDPSRLFSAFTKVWGIVALVVIPSAAGVYSLAPLLTEVVLGPKWTGAASLMALLAALGALQALNNCFWPILLTRRGPEVNFKLSTLSVGMSIPSFAIALWSAGLSAAVWAWISSTAVMLLVSIRMLIKDVDGNPLPLLRALFRPTIGAAAMVALLSILQSTWLSSGGRAGATLLVALVGCGVAIYVSTVALMWVAAGRPRSPERDFVFVLSSARKRL